MQLGLSTYKSLLYITMVVVVSACDDGSGVETANWSVNPLNNVLLLEGTGTPGATDLSFAKVILIEGGVNDGRFVVLNALVDDTNNDGMVDQAEFDINGIYNGVEVQISTP